MHSDLPKVLHPLAGRPLLSHVIDTARALGAARICVVYGHGGERVREALESRGLAVRADTATAHVGPDNKLVPDDIYQAAYQSYQTNTPSGFSLQLSWVTLDKRLVGANAAKPQALRKYPAP